MPGLFTLMEGDEESQTYLYNGDKHVDVMLHDLVTDIAEHAANEMRTLAPGTIGRELVETDESVIGEPGLIEAIAGVTPDITDETMGAPIRGLGSDPNDYPVFVDVGTGVHGEFASPIRTVPGNFMRIEDSRGLVFTKEVQGQEAQHFSERAYEGTVRWVPARLAEAKLPSGGT